MAGLTDLAKEAGLSPFSPTNEPGKSFNTSAAIEKFFALIVQKCLEGETVRIKDFGTFRSTIYKGRTLKSPLLKGGSIAFDDKKVLRFHQSTVAKKVMNGEASEVAPAKKAAKASAKKAAPAKPAAKPAKAAPKKASKPAAESDAADA